MSCSLTVTIDENTPEQTELPVHMYYILQCEKL